MAAGSAAAIQQHAYAASRARPQAPTEPEAPYLIFPIPEIARICGAPLENVAIQWPLVCAALAEFSILDQPTAIAAIATIGVEAGTFWPIEEYRMGNGSIPYYWHGYGGGWVYHGRGLIQLTHDYNYRALGARIGVDLVGYPDRALEPKISAFALAWYFANHGIQGMAHEGLWTPIRRSINGGYNGLQEYLGYVAELLRL